MPNRRRFLGIVATSAFLGSCTNVSPGQQEESQSVFNWRMATSWPPYLGVRYSVLDFCQKVSLLTSGRLVITPYDSGELVPPLQVLDGVAEGKAECGHTTLFYYTDRTAALNFATGVPFGLTAEQHDAWLYGSGGIESLNQILAKFGVVAFPVGNSGSQMGGWYRKKIERLADLRGLKMRITGLEGQILSRLGVEVNALAASAIASALIDGSIDAVEWIGPYDDTVLGLPDVAPYYYYPGWWEPGTSFSVVINASQWQALPPPYQAAMQAAAAQTNLQLTARYNVLNSQSLNRIKLRGVEILPFSDEILRAAKKTADTLYDSLSREDRDFAQIYGQWRQFRDRIYQWQGSNHLSFTQFSYQNLNL
ncbi:MAG: ABC transporter substrate-binding protein [Oscillatoriales cyanobacterium SM2_2_1]|nr:ABC transporter substrate-binding protein [Oscillatoriales cyanobacterium SM2_2_1]